MEILNGKEIIAARLDPFLFPQGLTLGAVPVPAGVIRYLQMSATSRPPDVRIRFSGLRNLFG
jgi:hypothetical protein